MIRKVVRANPQNLVFLECDIQSKFAKHTKGYESLVTNGSRLAQISQILDVPHIATHQVNLGPIDERITAHHHSGSKMFEKKTFSMLDENVQGHLDGLGSERHTAVLYGLETHVCVRQTALDLLEQGRDVHLVVDCTSSMGWHDRSIALNHMLKAGVSMISFQSLVYEMLRSADHPKFKACLPVVKNQPAVHLDWEMDDSKL